MYSEPIHSAEDDSMPNSVSGQAVPPIRDNGADNADNGADKDADVLVIPNPGPDAELVTPQTKKRKSSTPLSTPVRKRARNVSSWKRNINKVLKNSGQPYTTYNGKEHQGAKLRDPCSCSLDCRQRMTQEERQAIHDQFWKTIADHGRQWEFIRENCSSKETVPSSSKRKVARSYSFVIGKKKERVCKQMFMRTLDICDSWIETAFKKRNSEKGNTVSPDKRGGNRKGVPVVVTSAKIDSVREHVNLFPRIPSHYCRKRTRREYLEQRLSISKMSKLYVKWAADKKVPKNSIASQRQYRDIVNSNFNIGFYKPKKDQCSFCCVMRNKNNTRAVREERKNAWVAHLQNKKLARELKEKDKAEGMKEKTTAVISFDLQKQLSCPKSENSAYYYRSKLNVFNFTIFNMIERLGWCFLWHEGAGKKGSDEILSALLLYLEHLIGLGFKTFKLWSDNCAGQNKNRNLFAMYLYVASKYSVEITHRYLEPGHTQMEVDSIHANIERASEMKDIFDFNEWVDVIEGAKNELPKYVVKKLNKDNIVSFKSVVKRQNWEMDLKHERIKWTKVKELHVTGKDPNLVRLKYEYNQESYVTLSVNKRGHPINLESFQPPLAYDAHIPLKENTIQDLTWLCENFHIPINKQDFIRNVLQGVYPVEEEDVSDMEFDSDEERCQEDDMQEEDGHLGEDINNSEEIDENL